MGFSMVGTWLVEVMLSLLLPSIGEFELDLPFQGRISDVLIVPCLSDSLGALGFLALNDGVTNGNFGIADQVNFYFLISLLRLTLFT